MRTEEGRDCLVVRGVVRSTGHQLVEERRGTIEQERERTKVEIWVVSEGLLIALVSKFGKVVTIVETACGFSHHAEKSAIEFEIVALAQEVIVAGKGTVSLEFIVAVETRLTTLWRRDECRNISSSVCCIATDGKSLGGNISISKSETEESKEYGDIVADVI